MGAVKAEALKVIGKLSNNATWDDVMYELYVNKRIADGIKAAREGKVISHREVKKRFLSK